MPPPTPSQTIGPFFGVLIPERGSLSLVTTTTPGARVTVAGTVRDGAGTPVSDALVEIWQANAEGWCNHPDDTRTTDPDDAFGGFGRIPTDAAGQFTIETIKPGPVPGPDSNQQAPHLVVGLFARGLLTRLVTRVYFAGDALNDGDPILRRVPAERRATLIAKQTDAGWYRFDIILQGPHETVFFDV